MTCSFIRSWTPTSGTKLVKNSPPNMMRPKGHCTTRQGKIIIFYYFELLYKGDICYPPFTSVSVKLSSWSELIKFVEIRIMCGSHSEAETQVGFIIFYIYLDFRMVVALTSSTVHDIEFKGFQLSTWLALLLCFIHERWIYMVIH